MSVDIQKNQEQVARAAIERPTGAPATLSAEQKAAQELRKTESSTKAGTDWLQATAARRVGDAEIQRVAEASTLNTTPDAITGKRTNTTEVSAYDAIVLTGTSIRGYTESGSIESVKGTTEQDAVRKEMMAAVLRMAEQVPGADALFKDAAGKAIPSKDKDKIITGLMNDPEFMAFVKSVQSERSDPQNIQQELGAAMLRRKTYEQKMMTETQAQEKHDALGKKITELKKDERKFDATIDPKTSLAKGEYAREIVNIDTAVATLVHTDGTEAAYIARNQLEVSKANAQREAAQRRLENLPVNASKTLKDQAADDLADEMKALALAQKPLNELALLRQRQEDIRNKHNDVQGSIVTTQEQQALAKDVLDNAKHETIYAKADFDSINPAENLSANALLTEASRQYFEDRLEKLDVAQQAKLEEELAKSKSEVERKAKEELARKWMQDETRGAMGKFFKGDRGLVVNETALKVDFDKLLLPPPAGGPDALRTALEYGALKSDGTPNPNPLSDEQWANVQDFAIQKLIERKLQAGGLKEGEARVIYDSPWGEAAIGKAIASNKNFSEGVLGGLIASGDLEGTDMGSIRKFVGKHPVWSTLLLSILMGVGAGVLLPAGAVLSAAGGLGAAGVTSGSVLGASTIK